MPELEITAMTFGPYGIGRLGGKAVMVPNCAPGDVLEVEIESERRDYMLAKPVAVIRAGPDRRTPPCPFLPRCGGCDWQQIAYPAQVRLKGEIIAEELGRALGVTLDAAGLVEPAPAEFGYRSRIRLKAGPGGTLGFRELGSNRIVKIDRCMVAAEGIRLPQRLAAALGRNLDEIEVARDRAREVLIAHLARAPGAAEIERARAVMEADREIAGIVMRGGRGREAIGDPAIAIELEARTRNHGRCRSVQPGESRSEPPPDRFRDGSRGRARGRANSRSVLRRRELQSARRAPRRRSDGRRLGAAGRRHGRREREAAGLLLRALLRDEGGGDCGVPDPRALSARDGDSRSPHAGALNLIDPIARLGARSVIYVSCNLTTLARDLRALETRGYRLETPRVFDLFPNTHHVELVAHAVLT